jgi:hypothetical protein
MAMLFVICLLGLQVLLLAAGLRLGGLVLLDEVGSGTDSSLLRDVAVSLLLLAGRSCPCARCVGPRCRHVNHLRRKFAFSHDMLLLAGRSCARLRCVGPPCRQVDHQRKRAVWYDMLLCLCCCLQEGAALARAVLDRLAGTARLTLATSHHAELKSAAEEDSR